jgi:aspartyl-tRNA(Asn)/glutamyl-tRNA(Gln) amidotransferase subunit A
LDKMKLTVGKAAEMLRKKEIGAKELTIGFYDRIEETDKSIGAFLSLCREKAIEDAERAQKTIDKGNAGPLAGVPMAVKDNLCTEGIPTTCGSRMLETFTPPYTATAVKRLYNKNAVLLGKLNMDEFAMGGSTETSYFKKTRNPHDHEKVPGGSSGGSAAAVAAGQAVYTLGSDTGGSIRQPAAFCGVVGLKPTYGMVSRYGLVAFASSLDQIGPLANCVEDCALVFEAISGKDPMDATSVDAEKGGFTECLKKGVRGMRIAVPAEYMSSGVHPDIKKNIGKAVEQYEKLGAVCEEIKLGMADYAIAAYYIISSAEASSNLARYDGVKYGYRSGEAVDLLDLYKKTRSEGFGDEVKRRIMLGTYVLSSGYYDAYYKKALRARNLIKKEFDQVFSKYDFILGPSTPTTAFKIGEKVNDPLEMYIGDVFTVSVNIAGLPAISIPCGTDSNGMPVGMQLIGKAFGEKTILRGAAAFEKEAGTGLSKEVGPDEV